ncbi:MAG TPA: glutamyl-tRNA reductase [Tepidisphaeraceae bacterium]|nr:glutamyl-tRNA reductase [Tepidisphaeraceae bacterium]
MQRLLLLGLNHATAPLEVRERLAFTADQRAAALAALRRQFEGCEAVLLNTCNRVELYAGRAVHGRPREQDMIDFLAAARGVPPEQLRPHVYHKAERAAVEHLFSVASSVDSMVIGETQILGQVREAYDAARAAGAVGATLNPLFQRAVAVGKQVMTQTKITEGRVSVGSVAVECAGHIFDHYHDKTVLCVGAGKMAALVLQSFGALRPRHLLVCNRSHEKAVALARRFGGTAVPFDRLDDHLVAADVVVTSTGSPLPVVTRQRFEPLRKLRRYRPIFLIDIALPRDVEPAVGELENVYLYNLDDLQQTVAATQSKRGESVEQARAIIRDQVERYVSWHRARAVGPIIDRLYQRHHQLAKEEVERAINKMPNLSPPEREQLEELARRIVNKLLHDPVTKLREADAAAHGGGGNPGAAGAGAGGGAGGEGVASPYLHALEKLFQLDRPSGEDEGSAAASATTEAAGDAGGSIESSATTEPLGDGSEDAAKK